MKPSLHSDAAALSATPDCRTQRIRLRGLLVAALCAGAFVLGGRLHPQAGGLGTHEQVGLPACGFLSQTGWPCPGCGLTTSVAAMLHGRAALAWRAQPFGLVVVGAAALLMLAGAAETLTGRGLLHRLRPRIWWAAVAVGGLMAGWAVKCGVGWWGGRYPLP